MRSRSGMMILTLLALPWSAFTILGASDGGLNFIELLFVAYGGFAFLGTWVLLTIVDLRKPARRSGFWRGCWSYTVPLVTVGTLGLLWVDAPFRVRFQLSKGALEEFAAAFPPDSHETNVGWVGLFYVEWVDSPVPSVRFVTGLRGVDRCGVAYSPNGDPPVVGEDYYLQMEPGWWFWHRSF